MSRIKFFIALLALVVLASTNSVLAVPGDPSGDSGPAAAASNDTSSPSDSSDSAGPDGNAGDRGGGDGYGTFGASRSGDNPTDALVAAAQRCAIDAPMFVPYGQSFSIELLPLGPRENTGPATNLNDWYGLPPADNIYLGAIEMCAANGDCDTVAGKTRRDIAEELGKDTSRALSYEEDREVQRGRTAQHEKRESSNVTIDTSTLAGPGVYTIFASDLYYDVDSDLVRENQLNNNLLFGAPCEQRTITVLSENDPLAQLLAGVTGGAGAQTPLPDFATNGIPVCKLKVTPESFSGDTSSISIQWSSINASSMELKIGDAQPISGLNPASGSQSEVIDETTTVVATFFNNLGQSDDCQQIVRYASVEDGVVGDTVAGLNVNEIAGQDDELIEQPRANVDTFVDTEGVTNKKLDPVIVLNGKVPTQIGIDWIFPDTDCESDGSDDGPVATVLSKAGPVGAASINVASCNAIRFNSVPPEGEYSVTIETVAEGVQKIVFPVVHEE